MQEPIKISLLHTTYFRIGGPEAVRSAWMQAANNPKRVEYLVAVTSTDTQAISETETSSRVVVDPPEMASTAVRNWNRIAEIATGDLLFAIADDLFPFNRGWDSDLDEIASRHPPRINSYVVKIADSRFENDRKVRHPVVSRKFFAKHGLWNPAYSGMYVDSDLTLLAYWKSTIIDGRHIRFDHQNPIVHEEIEPSISFLEANSEIEYIRGKEVFDHRWPRFLQETRVGFVRHNTRWLRLASLKLKISEAISMVIRSRLLRWVRKFG